MNSTKVRKHSGKEGKKKTKKKMMEENLNIRYHDVNPEWNYTIYPRSTSKSKTE